MLVLRVAAVVAEVPSAFKIICTSGKPTEAKVTGCGISQAVAERYDGAVSGAVLLPITN